MQEPRRRFIGGSASDVAHHRNHAFPGTLCVRSPHGGCWFPRRCRRPGLIYGLAAFVGLMRRRILGDASRCPGRQSWAYIPAVICATAASDPGPPGGLAGVTHPDFLTDPALGQDLGRAARRPRGRRRRPRRAGGPGRWPTSTSQRHTRCPGHGDRHPQAASRTQGGADRLGARNRHRGGRRTRFEITTLRRDVETDGRHAVVAYTEDWRRMPRGGISPSTPCRWRATESYSTIRRGRRPPAGRVRFVGDPATRIAEDYLRPPLLPFLRPLRSRPPPIPPRWRRCARIPGLSRLSVERVWQEIRRIWPRRDPDQAVG